MTEGKSSVFRSENQVTHTIFFQTSEAFDGTARYSDLELFIVEPNIAPDGIQPDTWRLGAVLNHSDIDKLVAALLYVKKNLVPDDWNPWSKK